MNRPLKLLILIIGLGLYSWFPILALVPFPHFMSRNAEGALQGILLVAVIIGALVWVLWIPRATK